MFCCCGTIEVTYGTRFAPACGDGTWRMSRLVVMRRVSCCCRVAAGPQASCLKSTTMARRSNGSTLWATRAPLWLPSLRRGPSARPSSARSQRATAVAVASCVPGSAPSRALCQASATAHPLGVLTGPKLLPPPSAHPVHLFQQDITVIVSAAPQVTVGSAARASRQLWPRLLACAGARLPAVCSWRPKLKVSILRRRLSG